MEALIVLAVVIGLLVILDVAALKWGYNARQTGWLDGSYDPRYDWNSPVSDWDKMDNNNGVKHVRS